MAKYQKVLTLIVFQIMISLKLLLNKTCITTRLYMILSYQVSNERVHHGWVQKKISNNGTSRLPEKAVLGASVVNRVQNEYPNVLSQKGRSCLLSLPLAEGGGGAMVPAAPVLQASLAMPSRTSENTLLQNRFHLFSSFIFMLRRD